jgi:hypothetical protein
MSVNWFRVKNKLKQYYPNPEEEDLNKILKYLYEDENLSLEKITKMTDRLILCPNTLRSKLEEIGLEIKPRGSTSKDIPLTLNDFVENSAAELAKKYNVNVTTIYVRKEKLLKEEAK